MTEFVDDLKNHGFVELGFKGWLSLRVGDNMYMALNPSGFWLCIEEGDEEMCTRLDHMNNIQEVINLYVCLTGKTLTNETKTRV